MRIFADFSKKLPMLKKIAFLFLTLLGVQGISLAQLNNSDELNGRQTGEELNTITTAVPFLMIAPDSRSGALGDAGVALSPDGNSAFWNPAKLAYLNSEIEGSLSYSPWLRALVNDMSLAYLSFAKKLNKSQGFGASMRYFTLGNITFTDEAGSVIRDFKPSEYAVDVSFGQKLSEKLSGGIAARYVNSNLTGGTNVLGADSRPGRTGAVDVGFFYTNDDIKIGKKKSILNLGINISNIGAKMRYTNTDERDFIPTNLKLGSSLAIMMDEYNSVGFTVDLNKLLVPTPPVYDPTDEDVILLGKNPDVGVATGIIQSFFDAPGKPIRNEDGDVIGAEKGSSLKEELREINIGGGFEYKYTEQFAFRTGYFYEHYTKGNRQFITLGAGLKYNVITVDMSYLISTTQQNPLANTLRFTLRLTIGDKASRGDDEGPSED